MEKSTLEFCAFEMIFWEAQCGKLQTFLGEKWTTESMEKDARDG